MKNNVYCVTVIQFIRALFYSCMGVDSRSSSLYLAVITDDQGLPQADYTSITYINYISETFSRINKIEDVKPFSEKKTRFCLTTRYSRPFLIHYQGLPY